MANYKVLIIEDDEIMNSGLCYQLQKKDIAAYPVYTLKEAKSLLDGQRFDLILLDVNLPDGNGFDFAGELVGCDTPFLFLTAHSLENEVINGFQLGADDYITKPFSIKIVLERIQAVLRRCGAKEDAGFYSCGRLSVDFKNRMVKKEGEIVSLTPTEFDLLKFFCLNRDQILTKEILLDTIWDSKGNFVNEHTLSLNISRLRNKIADKDFGYIKTIYGLGYKWIGAGEE